MRFYDIDGIEMDVQDPKFFIDEENLRRKLRIIKDMLTESEFLELYSRITNHDYGITI